MEGAPGRFAGMVIQTLAQAADESGFRLVNFSHMELGRSWPVPARGWAAPCASGAAAYDPDAAPATPPPGGKAGPARAVATSDGGEAALPSCA